MIDFLATIRVDRPTRNGTFIYFRNAATNAVVQQYDCGWASEVTYTGFTIVIRFPVAPWVPGQSYYVTFDSGMFVLITLIYLCCILLFDIRCRDRYWVLR